MGWVLHARRYPKGGQDSREHCDDNVEDFAPCRIVVECTHNVLCFNYSPQKYPYTRTECELARISKGTGERLTLKVKSWLLLTLLPLGTKSKLFLLSLSRFFGISLIYFLFWYSCYQKISYLYTYITKKIVFHLNTLLYKRALDKARFLSRKHSFFDIFSLYLQRKRYTFLAQKSQFGSKTHA